MCPWVGCINTYRWLFEFEFDAKYGSPMQIVDIPFSYLTRDIKKKEIKKIHLRMQL